MENGTLNMYDSQSSGHLGTTRLELAPPRMEKHAFSVET